MMPTSVFVTTFTISMVAFDKEHNDGMSLTMLILKKILDKLKFRSDFGVGGECYGSQKSVGFAASIVKIRQITRK